MSSPSFELPKFVLWAPDCADDGALARRMAVRPVHLENANRLIQQGILRGFFSSSVSHVVPYDHGVPHLGTSGVAGGVMTAESIVAAPSDKKSVGSCMIYEAEDLEAVRKLVENDVYYKTGVVRMAMCLRHLQNGN